MAAPVWVAPFARHLGCLLAAVLALALAPISEAPLTIHVTVSLRGAAALGVVLLLAASLLASLLGQQGPPATAEGREPAADGREAGAEGAAARGDAPAAPQGEEAGAEAEPAEALSTEQLLRTLKAWRCGSAAADDEAPRRAEEDGAIQRVWQAMVGASPALLHRFSAAEVESQSGHAATLPFMACGCLWSLKMGPIGSSAPDMRYFCVLPHGHRDRLQFSMVFAKQPGEGYRERLVLDWPQDLAGHPWGPTVSGEELAEYRQTDGSILMMLHAFRLGSERDPAVDAAG